MRRPGSVALLVLVSTAALVVAANVHFIQGPTVTATNTSLTVSGTLAGLGNQDITIQLNAQATVTCTNKGGNPPPGQTESVSATISGLRAENGTLKFSITAQASNPCPDGMRPIATFSNVTITVTQGGRVVLRESL